MKGRKSQGMSDRANPKGRGCEPRKENPCRLREERKTGCQDLGLASWWGAGAGQSDLGEGPPEGCLGVGTPEPTAKQESGQQPGGREGSKRENWRSQRRPGERPWRPPAAPPSASPTRTARGRWSRPRRTGCSRHSGKKRVCTRRLHLRIRQVGAMKNEHSFYF